MLSVQEFIYSVVKHWRILIVVCLISALVGGGYYAASHSKTESPAQDATSDVVSTTDKPEIVVRTDWEKAEEHYVLKLNYICVGNKDVESDIVLDAYKANLSGTQFLTHLKEEYFTEEDTLEFISQIVMVDNKSMANCLTVKCLYYDEEEIAVIADIIDTYISNLYENMKPALGDHKMLMVDSSVLKGYDDETAKWLDSIKAYVKTEKKVIASVKFSLKDMLVNVAIFGFVGLFAAAIIILLVDSLSDKIYNAKQIKKKEIDLLGDISYSNLDNCVDRFLYRLLISRHNFTSRGVAGLVALKLDRDKNYTITGKVSEEKLADICSCLSQAGLNVAYKPLPDSDAADMAEWSQGGKMIFAVRRFEENTRDTNEWLDTCSDIGMDIAGILFI